jgi:hypothetical protein
MSKHTPTPWMADWGYGEGAEATYVSHNNRPIADCAHGYGGEDAANAAFIVHAVNNHQRLVDFAKYVLELDPENDAPLFAKARHALSGLDQ